jgi:hypothetical protein
MRTFNETSESSSTSPPESDGFISDVLRETLAHVLAETQETWERERKLIEAQAQATMLRRIRLQVAPYSFAVSSGLSGLSRE